MNTVLIIHLFIPELPECCRSLRDHYELKIHLKFDMAGQNSSCCHIYKRGMKESLAFLGCIKQFLLGALQTLGSTDHCILFLAAQYFLTNLL